ncbi:MAG: type VI secretion system tip protein VgrG [Desulfobacterales bacterium]|nr:type VI secretion system tip protein VgrG [Desulfobacterales bacterium]
MNSIKTQIFSNGSVVSSDVVNVEISKSVNKIPSARVVLSSVGADYSSVIEMSNQKCFKPGEELEITLAEGETDSSFNGVVVKHHISKDSNRTLLTVDLRDTCFKLTLNRHSNVYTNKNDKTIISEIAARNEIDIVCDEETCMHKQLVQYYCSDWDFIVSRAEANGLVVSVKNGIISLNRPDFSNASTEISEIYEFEMEVDMHSQFKEVESVCWDIKKAKCGTFKNSKRSEKSFESSQKFNKLSKDIRTETDRVVSGVYGEKQEMKAWADARMLRNRFSMLTGTMSVKGNPQIHPGNTIKISGMGDMFNCTTVVSGLRHRITKEGWITDLQCGLSNEWFYKKDDVVERPASGLLPGINGLQTGVVSESSEGVDPEKIHRIKVKIPTLNDNKNEIWARLLFPYAGKGRGAFFVPEKGDEVVVGFFNDDPRHAVVLGSLFNGTTETPLPFSDQNNEKGIITRSGVKIVISDEQGKESIRLNTPAGNVVLLEDENGITIQDKNSNSLVFNDTGIVIEDKNKNKITADDKGIVIVDINRNSLTFSNEGIAVVDLNGNEVKLEAAGVTVQSGSTIDLLGTSISMN